MTVDKACDTIALSLRATGSKDSAAKGLVKLHC